MVAHVRSKIYTCSQHFYHIFAHITVRNKNSLYMICRVTFIYFQKFLTKKYVFQKKTQLKSSKPCSMIILLKQLK